MSRTALSRTGSRADGEPVVQPGESVAFRRRLWQLALGLVLPAVALAAAGLISAYRSERQATETLLRETTRALAGTVDRELAKAEATLRALAESHYLRTGDHEAFHARARRLTVAGKTAIYASTGEGTPLLHTGVAYGEPLRPSRRVETFRRIAASGRAELSDLFMGGITGQPIAVLEIPVPDKVGDQQVILGMTLSPGLFQQIVDGQRLPESWNGAVLDGSGAIVARSRGTSQFAGQPARPRLVEAIKAASEGSVESVTLDGTPARSFFSRSPAYGWTFVIGYPKAEFTSSLLRSLGWLSALVVAVLAGLGLAWLYARSLVRPVHRLAESARALGRGQAVDRTPTGVEELDVIAGALAEAESDLVRRERDREEAQARIRDSEAALRLALDAGRLGAWTYDAGSRRFDLSESCASLCGLPAGREVTLDEVSAQVHPADRARLRRALTEALETRGPFEISLRVLDEDGGTRWFDLRGRHVDRAGRSGLVGVGQDVTEKRAVDERQKLLLHELNHRVKNTLATVQSIAFMTRRSQGDAETLWQRFVDRLEALAKTNDLLTAQDWAGASLRDLLAAELAPYQDETGGRIVLAGAPVSLSPRAVLAFGLVVHELATNAAKYGALSIPGGTVAVSWSVAGEADESRLHLDWRESGGPPVSVPTRKGFGSRLIERGVGQQLGGTITLDYALEGLRCAIDVPLDPVLAKGLRSAPAGSHRPEIVT